MDGILNVLKPPGMTSFDVIAYLRKVLGTRKIGHTGTLDPEATGVLPLCIGRATKAVEFLVEKDKTYRAELTLGITTDTCDSTGNVLRESNEIPLREEIINVVHSFKGIQKQIPPMYSAISINGVRLYKLAREGKVVEREPREVAIHSIDVIDFLSDRKLLIDVKCSKGTYIRTLCADIGEKLGCGAHMSYLLRLASGNFKIENALTLEEIADLSAKKKLELIPVYEALKDYNEIKLWGKTLKRYINGEKIQCNDMPETYKHPLKYPLYVNVFSESKEFIGVGEIIEKNGQFFIKSKKLFNTNSGDE